MRLKGEEMKFSNDNISLSYFQIQTPYYTLGDVHSAKEIPGSKDETKG